MYVLCAADHKDTIRGHHYIVLNDLLQKRNCDENSSKQGQLNSCRTEQTTSGQGQHSLASEVGLGTVFKEMCY